jgi:hypothetical protein
MHERAAVRLPDRGPLPYRLHAHSRDSPLPSRQTWRDILTP